MATAKTAATKTTAAKKPATRRRTTKKTEAKKVYPEYMNMEISRVENGFVLEFSGVEGVSRFVFTDVGGGVEKMVKEVSTRLEALY